MTPHERAVEAAVQAGRAAELTTTMVPGEFNRRERTVAEAAIRAYLAAMAEAGWKMVPREATEEMVEAAWRHVGVVCGRWAKPAVEAGIDAAPAPDREEGV